MKVDRQMIEFTPDDIDGVVAQLAVVIERGAGWLNIEPIVGEVAMDELRGRAAPAIVRAFSGRGGKIPFGTFVPGDHRKGALGQVGLEHSAGPRGLQQLRDAGVVMPAGWRMRQDHGKRGIVCDVPRDEAPATIVRWILDASIQLCEIDLTGWWTAVINLPK
ncbi:MAG: hypothetical protein E6G39_02420 [Actinobacteria bacterium]|nr:MAG: hypothetical protein E6G39_02420 [Actinomycetota bacterium]